jgi:hypothetical protein
MNCPQPYLSIHQRSRFENDKVLRTDRPTRCRSVLFQRSTCAVSPVSLPTQRCVSTGNTTAYASQKSLKLAHCRYGAGILRHRRRQVRSLRSPMTKARTWRVRRHTATVSRRVSGQTTRLHHVPADHRVARAEAWRAMRAMSGVFFYPGRQGFSGDAEEATEPAPTGPFVMGPEDFFLTCHAVLMFWGDNPGRPAIFAQILLAAGTIMAVFDNIQTSAFTAFL